ncbi:MAG TPA: hypothetical protein VN046_11955, partial [Stenotrophobium sp.]|nr:hypothetical protein [Stenotrophobium sp.]
QRVGNIGCLILGGLMLCLSACGAHKPADFRVVLPADGLSLELPPHWQAGLANGDVRYSAHPLDAAGQVIPGADFYIERGIAPATDEVPALTAYAMAKTADLQALNRDFRQLQSQETPLDGQPALRVQREYSNTSGSYRESAVMVVRNHAGYSFVGRARTTDFDRLQPDIQKLLDSVRWQVAK